MRSSRTITRTACALARSVLPAALSLSAVAHALEAQQAATAADLIVTNARIYTVDEGRPSATALAVKDGRILFVGSAREAAALRGAGTRMLDLEGKTVIPGMVDAHAHFLGLGQSLRTVDLTGTRSYEEVVARVAERARTTPKGQWILGRGWDQNDWGDTRFPTHEALSRALPDHPVWLERVDGHAALANTMAMQAARVTAATQDPAGGKIERAADRAPSGVFIDNAQGLVERAVPPMTREQLREAITLAQREMHRWGLTGMHDAGASPDVIAIYDEMGRSGALQLRLNVMISDDSMAIARAFRDGPKLGLHGGKLWVRSVKLYSDGALGSRGAALLEPYADDPKNSGLLVSAPAHIQDVATRALRAGFQVNTHAIGDRGNRLVLDAYEAALKAVPTADHRFRVEHAQVLHSDDIPRFAALGVIPSMQAVHQTSDMYWAGTRLGSTRVLGAYAWRSLLATGAIIPNGSDFPVEAVNPLLSFNASVRRQDPNSWPAGGWLPEQRMTREEALRSMTLWPAVAAFQEKELGTLTPGKWADFVVLDRDIMTVGERDILGATVLSTWVGGRAVYERGK